MTLTVYSRDFDNNENVVNNGFSGKIFVESKTEGQSFDSIWDALEWARTRNVNIEAICYCYREGSEQYCRKFWLEPKLFAQNCPVV